MHPTSVSRGLPPPWRPPGLGSPTSRTFILVLPPQWHQVSLPSGPAVEATYTLPLNATTTVYGTQVYNQHGGSVFISTFTAGEKSVETKAAGTVMPSWRFATR